MRSSLTLLYTLPAASSYLRGFGYWEVSRFTLGVARQQMTERRPRWRKHMLGLAPGRGEVATGDPPLAAG